MSSRVYRDFVIFTKRIDVDSRDGRPHKFIVRVFDSPAGEGEHDEEIQIDDWEQLEQWRASLAARNLSKAELEAFGTRLRELILPDYALQLYRSSLSSIAEGEGLRVRLRLPDELAFLPWEYTLVKLHDGEAVFPDYWVMNHQVSVVRHQEVSIPAREFRSNPERRVIVAMASPEPYNLYAPLDLNAEQSAIRSGLNRMRGVSVRYLPDFEAGGQAERASEDAIRDALEDRADIFHFTGHGHFKPDERCGVILLSGTNNAAQEVRADELSQLLGGGQIRLAVLGACETGERDMFLRWSCIATALLGGGIPAVVAMQFSVYDDLSREFARVLYENLVAGKTIDEAVALARQAMHTKNRNDRDWGAPVLYLRNSGGNIFPPVTDEDARRLAEQASERDSTLADISLRWTRSAELASPAQQAVLRGTGEALHLTAVDAVLLLRSAVESGDKTGCWISQLRENGAQWLEQAEQGADASQDTEAALAKKHLGLDSPTVADCPAGITRLAWAAVCTVNERTAQTAALALLALHPEQVVAQVQSALVPGIANAGERRWRRATLLGCLAEEDASIADQLPRALDNPQDRLAVWWWRAWKHIHGNGALLSGWIMGGAWGAAIALGLYRGFLAIFNSLPVGTEFAVHVLWGFILGLGLMLGIVLARPLMLQDYGQPAQDSDRRVTRNSVLLGALGFCLANAFIVGLTAIGLRLSTFVIFLFTSYFTGLALSLALLHQPQAGWRLGPGGWLKRLGLVGLLFFVAQLPVLCEAATRASGARWLDNAQWLAVSIIKSSQSISFLYSGYPLMNALFGQNAAAEAGQCCFGSGLWSGCFAQWLSVIDAALVGIVLTVGITAGMHFNQTRPGAVWRRLKKSLGILA